MRGARLGSTIGAVGGLLFVVVNAGVFTGPGTILVRVVGVLAFAVVLWAAVVRAPDSSHPDPSPRALRTYLICVGAEVLAIPVGASVIGGALDHSEAVLPWVVLVVGLHFLPFAHAFGAPMFGWLGASLIAVAVTGAVVALAEHDPGPGQVCAVVAGFVLLAFAGAPALRHG